MRTGMLETKRAKLMAFVVTTLLVAAFQVALQAKPAHAWEVNLSARGAGQITEVTDAGLIAQDCSGGLDSPNSTPTGQIGDSCSPGSPTGNYAHGWIVEYRATAKPGFQFVKWQNHKGNELNTYNPVLCDGWNGPNGNNDSTNPTYTGTNCRFQIFENLQVQAVFEDKTAPSQPSVSGPTSPVSQSATFFISITSDPTFKQFECRIRNDSTNATTSFQTCSDRHSVSVTGLSDGPYTFQVQARDHSNNVFSIGSAPFTVDRTAPVTSITSGPGNNSTTQNRNADFAFSSTESGIFECNLTGPDFNSTLFSHCGSFFSDTTGTRSYSNLKDGTYTFKVRARDQAGNTDATPAERTWTINNVPTVDPASLTPAKAATGVSRTTNISATFSEEMAAVTLKNADNTSKTFKVQQYIKKTKKWKTIPATIALSLTGGKTTATLDPFGATEGTTTEKPLAGNKKFRAMITTGAKDLDSNPLAKNFVWTFNTGSVVG